MNQNFSKILNKIVINKYIELAILEIIDCK